MKVITNDFVLTSENSTELTQLKKLLESARKLLVALAQAKLGSKFILIVDSMISFRNRANFD